eukprot:230437_1
MSTCSNSSKVLSLIMTILIHRTHSQLVDCNGDCECPSSSSEPLCTLNCIGKDKCKDAVLTCRAEDPCAVNCNGDNSCGGNTLIDGSESADVTISCIGDSACKGNSVLNCGTQSCDVICDSTTSCEGTTVNADSATSFTCTGSCGSASQVPAPFAIQTASPTTSTGQPTSIPTQYPTRIPTSSPSPTPTFNPTQRPTSQPTDNPTSIPTKVPTSNPTLIPTKVPTSNRTKDPTVNPTHNPTFIPTRNPTSNPIKAPTVNPTLIPTKAPTLNPTGVPTTQHPTINPTTRPTANPSVSPTLSPATTTPNPTINPSNNPSFRRTSAPVQSSTAHHILAPTVRLMITVNPSVSPTLSPITTTPIPTIRSSNPTSTPTKAPTYNPTTRPTLVPTVRPTVHPSVSPTTSHPTLQAQVPVVLLLTTTVEIDDLAPDDSTFLSTNTNEEKQIQLAPRYNILADNPMWYTMIGSAGLIICGAAICCCAVCFYYKQTRAVMLINKHMQSQQNMQQKTSSPALPSAAVPTAGDKDSNTDSADGYVLTVPLSVSQPGMDCKSNIEPNDVIGDIDESDVAAQLPNDEEDQKDDVLSKDTNTDTSDENSYSGLYDNTKRASYVMTLGEGQIQTPHVQPVLGGNVIRIAPGSISPGHHGGYRFYENNVFGMTHQVSTNDLNPPAHIKFHVPHKIVYPGAIVSPSPHSQ